MRTVYLGTRPSPPRVLERLAETEHRPQLVVTRPDRPKGRGRRLQSPPVADAARALGLELDQPESVNADDARARIAAVAPDALVVCAFGALIKEPLLSDFEVLNVHPSLLPRWRGAAPVERAIMAGDRETGVAIMRLTAGLDEGPVALMEAEPIAPDDDYGTLAGRLEDVGARLLIRALDERPPFAEQPRGGRHLRREDHRRGPHAGPGRAGRGQRADRPRAAPAHRGAPRARRRQLPRRAPARAWATTARSSCSRCSRPAAGRCPTRTTCAGTASGSGQLDRMV